MAMNKILKKQVTNLKQGTIIRGKFKGSTYRVISKLGEGAIGTVYLCQNNQKRFALKMSDKSTSISMEVNVLKAMEQVQGTRLGPILFEVDDWIAPGGTTYSYYVMEYIHGETIPAFIRKNGSVWIGPLLLQLLEKLEALHQAGWVFGDLKIDNLLIAKPSPQVRWVDVGGITQIGRAIKEYTEFYDRGYWGMGSRRAEPSYDLFAVAMLCLEIYYPKRFSRPTQAKERYLFRKINRVRELTPYAYLLKNALGGKYKTAAQMKRELQRALDSMQRKKAKHFNRQTTASYGALEMVWVTLLSMFYILFSIFIS
ncbi:protein kinase domain-containing protein [Oceanobacillus sp. CAU 1775]